MIQEKLHIGLVENSQKQVIGMITQEDIIEELVGDIEDEFDRLPTIFILRQSMACRRSSSMAALAKTMDWTWYLRAVTKAI